jgi:CBS domain containing-hemolysin-like protein
MEKPSYYVAFSAALLVLLGLSLFFSLCETAFSSLSKTKLKNMAAKSKKPSRERLALKLLDVYDKVLSSVLIGNNIVNIAASALTTMFFVTFFGTRGASLATVAVTFVILVFCEISPKTLAKESPELTAVRAAPLLNFFIVIFFLFIFLAKALQKTIVKIFPAKISRSVTDDELLAIVGEMRQEGGINSQEEQMIRQAIEFDDITAAEIMTPRIDLVAVSRNDAIDEIDKIFAETGFSRLPFYEDTIENITGVIILKDFHHEVINRCRLPSEIVKPVVFIAKTMKISRLLQTLREKQSHMAVIVDEFGGTLGIVTIEDIIEELVGEIWDEHDEVVEEFRQNQDGSFTVLGNSSFHDMLEFINSKTADENANAGMEIPGTTVGNWLMENKGALPRTEDEFIWNNLKIRVSRIQRHRVMEVTVRKTSEK